jgi:hypothetical protein
MNEPRRPTLTLMAKALLTRVPGYPHVGPTDDEDDVAAVLVTVQADHRGPFDSPDDTGSWGPCTTCGDPWPCPTWVYAENVGIQYVGRAYDRVMARAMAVIDTTKENSA